jgi:hypothetical protein
MVNTLAYFVTELITTVKSLMRKALGVDITYIFTRVNYSRIVLCMEAPMQGSKWAGLFAAAVKWHPEAQNNNKYTILSINDTQHLVSFMLSVTCDTYYVTMSIIDTQHNNTRHIVSLLLSALYAESRLCWVSLMLSLIYGVSHLWWVSCMVSVIYGECHLWWVSFLVSIIYGEYHLWWVSLMAIVICGKYHLWQVSFMVYVTYG